MSDKYAAVKQSFGRCLNRGDLIGRFYELLLEADPVIPKKFEHTDMRKQKDLLIHGINLALMFVEGDPVGKNGLLRIRQSHSKKNLDINPELYMFWMASFQQAVSEIDPDYNDDIENSWQEVLEKTVNFISEGYTEY